MQKSPAKPGIFVCGTRLSRSTSATGVFIDKRLSTFLFKSYRISIVSLHRPTGVHDVATIVSVLGTRPEIIKFAPVLDGLNDHQRIRVKNVITGQQSDLLPRFVETLNIAVHRSLDTMVRGQSIGQLLARLTAALSPVIQEWNPRAVLVQGDTLSALAGALAGGFHKIPVIHIEAGLRSGDLHSPFPEELSRTLISHVAELHCAPTAGNVQNLLEEGIPESSIALTGNPIVDIVSERAAHTQASTYLQPILAGIEQSNIVVLTAHRRENFGDRIGAYFRVIERFISSYADSALVFPVHPNPNVTQSANEIFSERPRVHLIEPLGYEDFLHLLKSARLVLSDSGGIQEEIATLGTPLIILREKTERPEVLDTPLAQLAPTPDALAALLSDILNTQEWPSGGTLAANPFGDGHSGERIADTISDYLFR